MAIQTSDSETGNGYQVSNEMRSLLKTYSLMSRRLSIQLLEKKIKYMDKKTRLRALKVINCLIADRPYK
jgi:hypothetical protein